MEQEGGTDQDENQLNGENIPTTVASFELMFLSSIDDDNCFSPTGTET